MACFGGQRLYVENADERTMRTYEALGMVSPNYVVMEAVFGDTKC